MKNPLEQLNILTKSLQKASSAQEAEVFKSLINDVFNTSQVAIFILDKNFKVVWVNQTVEVYFGIAQSDIIGKDKRTLIQTRIKNIFGAPDSFAERVIATYQDNTYEEDFECHIPGTDTVQERWLNHFSQPIHSGIFQGGRIEHYTDITDRKLMETKLVQSRKQFQLLAESTYELVALHFPDGRYKYISPSVEEMLGYTADELIGTDPYELFHPDDVDRIRKQSHERALNGESVTHFEYRIHKKNGEYIWFDSYTDVVFGNDGEVIELITRSRDITEKKVAEQKLVRSEKRFRAIFKQDQAIKLMIDPNTGNILDANDAASEFYGYSLSELKEMNIKEINQFSETDVDSKMKNAEHLRENHFYFQHRLASGEIRDVEVYSTPIQYNNTRLLFSIIHDISDKVRTQKALEESEEKFRKAFNSESVAVAISRQSDGMYIEANQGFALMTGYTRAEIVGKTSRELQFFTDESRQKLVEKLQRHGELRDEEMAFPTKSGEMRTILFSLKSIALKDEDCFISTMVDITERKNAERTLQKSEENFRELYEKAPLSYQLLDETGRIIYVNQAWIKTTGYSTTEVLGELFTDFLEGSSKQDFDNVYHTPSTPDNCNMELEFRHKQGDIIHLSCHARLTTGSEKIHMIFRNITRQKEILDTMRKYAEQAENLKGIIPICASCNRIRDDQQAGHPWVSPAAYLHGRLSDTKFTHGICEECIDKWYPDNDMTESE